MELTAAWNNEAYDVVMDTLHEAGFVGYAVGGCVRDALLGAPLNDVDVATNARPHDLPKLFKTRPWDGDSVRRESASGVVLYPTGVRHGTWTVRVGDDEVEVTTFRKDVDTDGRNATVEFADTMEEDAMRRDFTMNALYCDRFNAVHDPTGSGVMDAISGQVRFVGDANERVQEDYLRILRLFRFHARFGRGPMDVDAWNAASQWAFMIEQKVSGERVWEETKKLLSLHDPFDAVCQMQATGVSDKLFEFFDPVQLGILMLHERRANCAPRWTRRYAMLCADKITYPCSNKERKAVEDLFEAHNKNTMSQARVAHEFGEITAFDWAVCNGAKVNHAEITRGLEAVMPVSAQDFMECGYPQGAALGRALRIAKNRWLFTDMEASKDQLMDYVDREVVHLD